MSSRHTAKTTIYFSLCVLILSLAFCASLPPRTSALGWMAEGAFEDQTARTLKFARNWYRDGITTDRFLQLENPSSVEFTSLTQRVPYVSFLSGTAIPVYVLALAKGSEPDIDDVQRVNLMTQFLTALLLSITTWLLAGQFGIFRRIWATLFVGLSYIFLPFLLYEHQQVYYSESALMLPYAAFICAVAYFARFPARWSPLVYAAILGFFIMVDWFGAIVGIVWAGGRLLRYRNTPKQAIKSVLPALVAGVSCGLLFLYHMHITNMISAFLNIAHVRTGMATDPWLIYSSLKGTFALYIKYSYGLGGRLLLFAGSAFFLLMLPLIVMVKSCRPATRMAVARLEIAMLAVVAPWLTLCVIPLHFHAHDFSPIRFAVPLLLVNCVLMVDVLADIFRRHVRQLRVVAFLLLSAGTANTIYIYNLHGYSWFNRSYFVDYAPFHYIHDHVGYNDVVFSPNYSSEFKFPTQDLSISMKRVYQLDNIADIANYTVDDFNNGAMGSYAYTQAQPITLPTFQSVYMLVMKRKPCWPLSIAGENFLKQHAILQQDGRKFSFYVLKPANYGQHNVRLCDAP